MISRYKKLLIVCVCFCWLCRRFGSVGRRRKCWHMCCRKRHNRSEEETNSAATRSDLASIHLNKLAAYWEKIFLQNVQQQQKKENWLLFRLHIAANFRGIEYLNSLIIEIIAINPEREWSSFSDDLNAPLSIARTRRCKRRIKHKKMMMMMKKQKKKEEVLL